MPLRDIGYALRAIRRSPGFSVAIVVTLGLGIGANAAVFTALDRVFFHAPPGVEDPSTVRRLYARRFSAQQSFGPTGKVTPALTTRDLLDLTSAARGSARVAGYDLQRGGRLGKTQRVNVTLVTPGYFDLLGVRPGLGRFFTPEETRVPGDPVRLAVVSYAFWHTHFARDPDVIGKTVEVDSIVYRVVGVAPTDFEGLELEATDLWVPLSNLNGGRISWLRVIARLERGGNARILDQLLSKQYRHTHAGDPDVQDGSEILTAPLLAARGPALAGTSMRRINGMSERSLGLLVRLAVVGLIVALLAVANAASLLLMRALQRRREIAVRLALGISRSRLVGQLVTESIVLGTIAGVGALVASLWAGRALRFQLAHFRWSNSVIDERVVLFAMGIAIVGASVAGLAPAVFALQSDVGAELKSSAGTTRVGRNIRAALLLTQTALCMALLTSAGVFLQSLRRAVEADRGFDPERTLVVTLPRYYESSEDDVVRVADTLRRAHGIEAVGRSQTGLADLGMLSKVGPTRSDTIGVGSRGPSIEFVEPEFLRAAGFRVVEGRLLTAADDFAPVAVLNEALAQALFPRSHAVGLCVHVREPQSPCRSIVGVVKDIRWDLTAPSTYRVYIPIAQAWSAPNPAIVPNYLVVRTTSATDSTDVGRVRNLIRPMIKGGADITVRRVSDLLKPELEPWQLAARLFLILGLLGLSSAAAGIYGLVAFDVTERSRELGIRIALGATSAHILRLVLHSGLRVVIQGAAAGAVVSLLAGRLMQSLLFATSPYDPLVLFTTAITLVATATLAALIPAWRVVRQDPARVLTSD